MTQQQRLRPAGLAGGETQLGLFALIDGQSLQKGGTATATDGFEDQEALETGTVIG
jgi:hypothetical protein